MISWTRRLISPCWSERGTFFSIARGTGDNTGTWSAIPPDVFPVQIHIWGKGDQVEIVRHRIMADWLKTHPDDLELYAETKRKAAAESAERGEKMMEYNERKKGVIRAILGRAFRSLGYI